MVAKLLAAFGLSILFFIIACTLALVVVGCIYHSKFYPGVSVGAVSLENQSQSEGSGAVQAAANSYTAHIVQLSAPDLRQPAQDGKYPTLTLTSTAATYGLQVQVNQPTQAAWAVGHTHNPITWLKEVLPDFWHGTQIGLPYVIHDTTLQDYLHTQVSAVVISAKPATLEVTNGVASVSSSVPGLQVDEHALASQLSGSLAGVTGSQVIRLTIPSNLVQASIQDKDVQPLADQLNSLGSTKVSFTGSGVTLRPTQAQLASWFTPVQSPSGSVALAVESDPVLAYLKTNSHVDTTKSLPIAVNALAGLLTGKPPTFLAVAITTSVMSDGTTSPGSYTLGRFPGKYIEVNLAEQKLYTINGNTLVNTYLVSSGKASTPTPTGQFYIGTKLPVQFSYAYGLYMPWWEAFLDNEYGIHELPYWPDGYREGEGHLGVPVSDGCVRLGIGAAEAVYNWTETGTPVYIY